MRRRVPERHETEYPGRRSTVALDVSTVGLQTLLEGTDVKRVWLTANDDGSYTLHADSSIGETRRKGVKPYIDVLTDAMNDFAAVLEAHDVPDEVEQAWDAAVDRAESYKGERA